MLTKAATEGFKNDQKVGDVICERSPIIYTALHYNTIQKIRRSYRRPTTLYQQ